jgi:hypothetical protein
MSITCIEKHIATFIFHPRLVPHLRRPVRGGTNTAVDRFGKTLDHARVEFAHVIPRTVPRALHPALVRWIDQHNLIMVTSDCGVIDICNSRVLAIDMLFASVDSSATGPPLTLCTIIINPRPSARKLHAAQMHAERVQTLVNDTYHIHCNSVVLVWGPDHRINDIWL